MRESVSERECKREWERGTDRNGETMTESEKVRVKDRGGEKVILAAMMPACYHD